MDGVSECSERCVDEHRGAGPVRHLLQRGKMINGRTPYAAERLSWGLSALSAWGPCDCTCTNQVWIYVFITNHQVLKSVQL